MISNASPLTRSLSSAKQFASPEAVSLPRQSIPSLKFTIDTIQETLAIFCLSFLCRFWRVQNAFHAFHVQRDLRWSLRISSSISISIFITISGFFFAQVLDKSENSAKSCLRYLYVMPCCRCRIRISSGFRFQFGRVQFRRETKTAKELENKGLQTGYLSVFVWVPGPI